LGGTACRRPNFPKNKFRDADTASLPKIILKFFRNLHCVERCAVGRILKIMDAAKATTVKSVGLFTKETARRVLKLI
jgi:hypothetical protein